MKRATQICSYFVKAFGYNHFKASIKASHTLFRELHGLMLLQDPWGVSFLVRNPCGWWPSLPEFRSDLLGSTQSGRLCSAHSTSLDPMPPRDTDPRRGGCSGCAIGWVLEVGSAPTSSPGPPKCGPSSASQSSTPCASQHHPGPSSTWDPSLPSCTAPPPCCFPFGG